MTTGFGQLVLPSAESTAPALPSVSLDLGSPEEKKIISSSPGSAGSALVAGQDASPAALEGGWQDSCSRKASRMKDDEDDDFEGASLDDDDDDLAAGGSLEF